MFRKYADKNIVVFDGGMGTSIQQMGLTDEDWGGKAGCSEYLNLVSPQIIETIHENFLKNGADVVETNTFGGIRLVLTEYDLEDQVREINLKGAQIARKVADKYGKFVAGSIGPGTKLPSLGQISYDDMLFMYSEQTDALIDGGVDVLIVETCQDLLQVKATLQAVFDTQEKKGKDLPVMVSVTIEANGTMLVGSDLMAVVEVLRGYPIYSLGINCALGPDMMHSPLKILTELWDRKISCIPNAGLPETVNDKVIYSMTPEKMSEIMGELLDQYPLDIIGGCCGTTFNHTYHMKEIAKKFQPKIKDKYDYKGTCSSIFTSTILAQEPAPTLIGERANSNGSKAFRELLLKDDFDGMLKVAQDQEETGAHFIDLCVAYVERKEINDMSKFTSMINRTLTVPAVIDSTDPNVIAESLKRYAGKPIINSINLEDGGEKLHKIVSMIKKSPAAVIALTIDEEGMAMTATRKFEVANRMYKIWTEEYGLPAEDIIFDTLTFSVGSGDKTLIMSAMETLEAIKMIKDKLPGVKTVLGLSNVSFGLSPASRVVLNSVFLNRAVVHGLDMAIVHASKVLPDAAIDQEEREAALNLILGKDGSLEKFIEVFADFTLDQSDDNDIDLSPEDRIKKKLMKGDKTDLVAVLDDLLLSVPPYNIINNILLAAMKEVGVLFGEGKMLLPFVLQSAEVMKLCVSHLEQFMDKSDIEPKGKIVLATVKGDVHDIGKNLVEIILSNNGYEVHNLGIKVPVEDMIRAAIEQGADAIGMSGLLVQSTVYMKDNIKEIVNNDLNLKVLLGGAALTEGFVKNECDPLMPGNVYYCSDAFDALSALDQETAEKSLSIKEEGKIQIKEKGSIELKVKGEVVAKEKGNLVVKEKAELVIKESGDIIVSNERSDVKILENIPEAPFFGIKTITDFDFDEVLKYMNKQVLFGRRWGYLKKGTTEEEYNKLLNETVIPEYNRIVETIKKTDVLDMKAVYGYFRCHSEGNSIHIKNGSSNKVVDLMRQKTDEKLCLADYLKPKRFSDAIAMQVVTVGEKPLKFALEVKKGNNYKDYFLYHGFFSEMAEAMAEYLHTRIRKEWNIHGADARTVDGVLNGTFQGQRFSFGYASCPNMAGNGVIGEFLDMEKNIDIKLTDSYEMVPEYSTSALIFHHPQAKHFVIK